MRVFNENNNRKPKVILSKKVFNSDRNYYISTAQNGGHWTLDAIEQFKCYLHFLIN